MHQVTFVLGRLYKLGAKRIEYILEWNLLEKSVKLPFCCTVHTAGVFHIFWALENHFIENLKLM